MSMNVPALGINIKAINNNLPSSGDNKFVLPGITPASYEGFGQVQDMANPDTVAYFFKGYADESTNTNGPACNIRISTQNEKDGGRRLINDIIEYSGDDAFLSQEELQTWADEIGFTGDINAVMQTMGEMDDWLCGQGTLDVEHVDPESLKPQEESEPDGTTPEETTPAQEEQDKDPLSVADILKGMFDGLWGFLFG